MSEPDPGWLDLKSASELIARGELRAANLVEFMLSRIERLNPKLNAYVAVLADAARAEAAMVAPFNKRIKAISYSISSTGR